MTFVVVLIYLFLDPDSDDLVFKMIRNTDYPLSSDLVLPGKANDVSSQRDILKRLDDCTDISSQKDFYNISVAKFYPGSPFDELVKNHFTGLNHNLEGYLDYQDYMCSNGEIFYSSNCAGRRMSNWEKFLGVSIGLCCRPFYQNYVLTKKEDHATFVNAKEGETLDILCKEGKIVISGRKVCCEVDGYVEFDWCSLKMYATTDLHNEFVKQLSWRAIPNKNEVYCVLQKWQTYKYLEFLPKLHSKDIPEPPMMIEVIKTGGWRFYPYWTLFSKHHSTSTSKIGNFPLYGMRLDSPLALRCLLERPDHVSVDNWLTNHEVEWNESGIYGVCVEDKMWCPPGLIYTHPECAGRICHQVNVRYVDMDNPCCFLIRSYFSIIRQKVECTDYLERRIISVVENIDPAESKNVSMWLILVRWAASLWRVNFPKINKITFACNKDMLRYESYCSLVVNLGFKGKDEIDWESLHQHDLLRLVGDKTLCITQHPQPNQSTNFPEKIFEQRTEQIDVPRMPPAKKRRVSPL